MSFATDFDDVMTDGWGAVLTIARRSVVYASSGSPTVTWVTTFGIKQWNDGTWGSFYWGNGTITGQIQPYSRSGDSAMRTVGGIEVAVEYETYIPSGFGVLEGDRVRPAGWQVGRDEYDVLYVMDFDLSHIQLLLRKVKGHGG